MNRAYRAMDFIGDDLIERSRPDLLALVRPRTALWVKSVAVAASAGLIVGGAYLAGFQYGIKHPPEIVSGRDTLSATTVKTESPKPPSSRPMSFLNTMETIYSYSEGVSVFAKMRIDEILGNYRENGSELSYLVIKCTVLEDYYGSIEGGAKTVIPISLSYQTVDEGNSGEFEARELAEFLLRFDSLFVYTGVPRSQPNRLYSADTNQPLQYDEFTSNVSMYYYDLLPVSYGELDLRSLRDFFKERNASMLPYECCTRDFWGCVQDGIDELSFARCIFQNKCDQVRGKQK